MVCLAGLGEMGMVVGALSLVTSSSIPKHIRGSVAGISTFVGSIGILFNTKLGGYLFDVWTEGAPFFLIAMGHALCTLAAIVVITLDILNARQAQHSADEEKTFWQQFKALENSSAKEERIQD